MLQDRKPAVSHTTRVRFPTCASARSSLALSATAFIATASRTVRASTRSNSAFSSTLSRRTLSSWACSTQCKDPCYGNSTILARDMVGHAYRY